MMRCSVQIFSVKASEGVDSVTAKTETKTKGLSSTDERRTTSCSVSNRQGVGRQDRSKGSGLEAEAAV